MPNQSSKITAIVGAQWGDEGKGKITDFFAGESDYVVRFHGGNNAGHTVIVNNKTYKLHLIPSGVVYGKPISVIGNGVVVDPKVLLDEIEYIIAKGITPKLMISDRAHVIMPYHIILDSALSTHQGKLAAGSTGKGIAPVYADKMFRNGIRMVDLLDPKVLEEKLEKGYLFSKKIIEGALRHKLDVTMESILKSYLSYGKELAPYICDTSAKLYKAYKDGKSILFEGAQGISLDVDHGIYPFTTSSNTATGHISTGTGVSYRELNRVIGVVKGYLSRVGESPLPTEIHGAEAESLREKGSEYGTTTGRPRRVGWLDLVQVRQAVRVNGLTEIALTKLDILNNYEHLKVCVSYDIDGEKITEIPASLSSYRKAKPIYETLPGWKSLPEKVWEKGYESLPQTLKEYISFIEDQVSCSVKIISVGPQRHETILR